jgi:hypothetical protein
MNDCCVGLELENIWNVKLLTEDIWVGSWEIVRNVEMNEDCAELEVGNSREC